MRYVGTPGHIVRLLSNWGKQGSSKQAGAGLALSEFIRCVAWHGVQASKEEVGRRKAFEDAIKRPYFHVKPLDGAQLLAWSRYLDYAEERGDNTVTTHLYERCLVACAQYHGADHPP